MFSGPAIVTTDEIGNPHNLDLSCKVNDAEMQNSNTNQMIFDIWDILMWVTKFITVRPGDVILTGSPPGSGKFHTPRPQFLKVQK